MSEPKANNLHTQLIMRKIKKNRIPLPPLSIKQRTDGDFRKKFHSFLNKFLFDDTPTYP